MKSIIKFLNPAPFIKRCRVKNNLSFALPVLSGILLIIAYPPSSFGILVLVALIPLFYFLSLNSTNLKKAFLGGTLTGIIFFGKLFSWFFSTYPFEWLGIIAEKDIALTLVLVTFIWLAQIIFFGLFIGFFSWAIKKLCSDNLSKLSFDKFHCLFIIPAFWIILEYLRAWGFELLWLGKETLFGPHWTFGNLTYTLYNNLSLIQIADIIGIYGISFLIVCVNALLFRIIKNIKISKKSALVSVLILLFIALIWKGYGAYQLQQSYQSDKSAKIALLQTNFLSGSEFHSYQTPEVFKTVLNLFQLASPAGGSTKESADIIIAPEGFGIATLTGDKKIAKYLLKDFFRPGPPTGEAGQIYLENQKIIDENNSVKSRLFYYDLEKEKPLGFHDKVLLVPGGDYAPYWIIAILKLYSFNMKVKEKIYNKGETIEPVLTPKGNIGGTICSSILSPNIIREMTKKGAEFLVSVSSDAPFHGENSLLAQNLAMSKLRAIENRRYFAQATNMGYSFLLSPTGKILIKTPQLGNSILFSDIYLLNKKTIYTRFGDWVIILASIIGAVTITCYNKNKGKNF